MTAISVGTAAIAAMSGCGGGGPIGPAGGCGGVLAGATVKVQYPARSRADLNPPLSSAMSGTLVLTGANPGGGNVTVNFNRDTGQVGSHIETYNMPNVSTGSFTAKVTLYADVNQGGAIVGTATAVDKVTCAGQSVTGVTLTQSVKSVEVTPANLTVGGGTTQLVFTAKDSLNFAVVVSAGSAIFKSVGVAATVTADGIATPVSAGSVQVTATVDGVTSPAASVNVVNAPALPKYHLYEIKPVAANDQSIQIEGMNSSGVVVGAAKNSSTDAQGFIWTQGGGFNFVDSYCLSVDDTGNVFSQVVNASGTTLGSWFNPVGGGARTAYNDGGVSGTAPWFIFGNGSAVAGRLYWSSPTAVPVSLPLPAGITTVNPQAANSSGLIIGSVTDATSAFGMYWTNGTTVGAALQGVKAGPLGVSSDGRIVGVVNGTRDMYYWPSPTSAPTTISLANTTLIPLAVNNKGLYVGSAQGDVNSFVLIGNLASGPVDLSTLLDSSGAGWTLAGARAVNDQGWIAGYGTNAAGKSAGFLAKPL